MYGSHGCCASIAVELLDPIAILFQSVFDCTSKLQFLILNVVASVHFQLLCAVMLTGNEPCPEENRANSGALCLQ
jgi:hypothetical protein